MTTENLVHMTESDRMSAKVKEQNSQNMGSSTKSQTNTTQNAGTIPSAQAKNSQNTGANPWNDIFNHAKNTFKWWQKIAKPMAKVALTMAILSSWAKKETEPATADNPEPKAVLTAGTLGMTLMKTEMNNGDKTTDFDGKMILAESAKKVLRNFLSTASIDLDALNEKAFESDSPLIKQLKKASQTGTEATDIHVNVGNQEVFSYDYATGNGMVSNQDGTIFYTKNFEGNNPALEPTVYTVKSGTSIAEAMVYHKDGTMSLYTGEGQTEYDAQGNITKNTEKTLPVKTDRFMLSSNSFVEVHTTAPVKSVPNIRTMKSENGR